MIDPFQPIGSAQSFLVSNGQVKDRQALRQIFLQPGRKFRGAFGVMGDDFLEAGFGGGSAGTVKHTADGAGDFFPLLEPGHIGLGVLLQMELAALPGDGPKDGLARGGHAGMVVADDELAAAEAALNQAVEEGPPMHFGFAEGDADAEQGALAGGRDAQAR